MQNCKSIVAMAFECYFFITSSCIMKCDVSFTRNMRVKKGGSPVSMQNSGPLHVHRVYLSYKHGCIIMYCVIIIIFSRSKRVNKFICLCTRSDGNLLTCKFIGSMVSEICVFKRRRRICESHVYLYFVPCVIFSYYFLHAVIF